MYAWECTSFPPTPHTAPNPTIANTAVPQPELQLFIFPLLCQPVFQLLNLGPPISYAPRHLIHSHNSPRPLALIHTPIQKRTPGIGSAISKTPQS